MTGTGAESGSGGAVLVTGATGTVGRALVCDLLAAGVEVRAGVRDPGDAAVPAGAHAVRLDFEDPSTAAAALEGVDRLFLMRPPAISDVGTAMGPLVRAATSARVGHVVVLSVMGVNPALPHWRLERMVRTAGLPMTTLRPAYFAQNLITAFGDGIRTASQLRLAAGNGRVSFIDTRDVAAVAADAFTSPPPQGTTALTLTGPEALTFGQAADILTAELGRSITYHRQGLLQRRRELLAAGADPAYVRVQLVIDATTRLGLAKKVTAVVPELLRRPATPLTRFVRDHRESWTPGAG